MRRMLGVLVAGSLILVWASSAQPGEENEARSIVAKAIKVNNLTPHVEGADDDGIALDDVLTDDRSKAPDDLLIEADDLERIFEHLGQLDEREATVVRMRFGLDPYSPMPLREVGENLGLTRERVRQLENQALVKLMTALGGDMIAEPWAAP